MQIRELIEFLEEAALEVGDDAEVRLATQPSWPFESEICSVVTTADLARLADEEGGTWKPGNDAEAVVYLTEGAQIGYATKDMWGEF